jgi:hypothetical protein
MEEGKTTQWPKERQRNGVCFSACLFLVQIYLFAINLLDYF